MQTRRSFVQLSAASLLVAGALPANSKETTSPNIPEKWDMTTDVVVAGSGAAGMAAAITALDKGADVVVFEKGNYGGCSYLSGGNILIGGGSKLQKAHGSTDSPEAYFKRLTDPKNPQMRKNDPGLAKKVSELSPILQDFLEEKGVKFYDFYKGDNNKPSETMHTAKWPEQPESSPTPQIDGAYMTGLGIMIPLRNYFEKNGGMLLLGNKVIGVIQNLEGDVIGALVETPKGTQISVQAKKGVILAGGSWKANPELRKITDPRFGKNMLSTGYPYVAPDGSAILAGLAAGGMYVGSSGFDDAPHLRRKFGTSRYNWRKGSKYGYQGLDINGGKWDELIFTNKDGDRFFAEVDAPKKGAKPWFYDYALVQPEQKLWVIYDNESAEKNGMVPDAELCERGYAYTSDNLEDLAKITEQPHLVETVKRYNKFVKQKKDEDFQRPPETMKKSIEVAPFHAVRCVLGVHNLSGGLRIDENCRVLDKDSKPIKGLYAAGESAGCLYSFGNARSLITGEIAGAHVADVE